MDKVAIMNRAREKYRLEHDEDVKRQAEELFKQHKNEPLFIAGVMLYWAEGTRLTNKYRKYQLEFTNSDPEILEVYCSFLRKYFGNIEESLRAGLYIYKDINESSAKSFWSEWLQIPVDQFIKSQVLPSKSLLTKTKLPYGTCRVYLNKKDYSCTMQSWIESMSEDMRV